MVFVEYWFNGKIVYLFFSELREVNKNSRRKVSHSVGLLVRY